MTQPDPSTHALMADMKRALENGEMRIDLQPKFDLRAEKVTSAEMLVRWTHSTRGAVHPDLFVTLAEQSDAIAFLTHWVLRMAIDTQTRLRSAGVDMKLAVNLSARLVGDADFIAATLAILREAQGGIDLEITETANIGDETLALAHINALIEAGAHIAIDDYGQGASLAYLRWIPAHELKIDKAFIEPLLHSERDALVVQSMIDLAHSLNMSVTAEGVEDEAAFARLKEMGCDHVQGFLTGKPMPEAEFTERYAPR